MSNQQQQLQSIMLPKNICEFFKEFDPSDAPELHVILTKDVFNELRELISGIGSTKIAFDSLVFDYLWNVQQNGTNIDGDITKMLHNLCLLFNTLIVQKGGYDECKK